MTISEVTVKIECEEQSVSYTFKSEDGFDHCWQQIERYIKGRFDGKPTKTHIIHTSSFNV